MKLCTEVHCFSFLVFTPPPPPPFTYCYVYVCVCVRECERVCVLGAWVRACVRACVCVCVRARARVRACVRASVCVSARARAKVYYRQLYIYIAFVCQTLHSAFDEETLAPGLKRLILTAAVSGYKRQMDTSYEAHLIHKYVHIAPAQDTEA